MFLNFAPLLLYLILHTSPRRHQRRVLTPTIGGQKNDAQTPKTEILKQIKRAIRDSGKAYRRLCNIRGKLNTSDQDGAVIFNAITALSVISSELKEYCEQKGKD